jgi:YihY family inner membrane protein
VPFTTVEGVNVAQRAVARVDQLQRRWPVSAFAVAVNQKFGGDNGGTLAGILAYNAFLALFPLLLVLVTVLGIVAGGSSSITHRILHSALADFPVVGTKLADNIHALHRDSAVSLTIGLVGLLWGSLGAAQAGQYAMAEVWNIPKRDRPGFLPRLARSVGLVLALGVFLVVGTGLSAVAADANGLGQLSRVLGVVGTLLVDIGLMATAFRILTPRQVPTRQLVPGVVVAGVAWAILQSVGTLVVYHDLRGVSALYGFFAIVLGALAWLTLTMRIVLYAAEINVVWARRLWPRALAPPPLTDADRIMLVTYVEAEARRREVDVRATVHATEDPQSAPRTSTA